MGAREEIKGFIKSTYDRSGLALIPLRLGSEESDGKRYGKIPAIKGWQEYSNELPDDDEIDSWDIIGNPTGVGIVCGEASNIACIDIDTEDPELIADILKLIPWNAPCILGKKNRGGKFLFKLKEYDNEEIPFDFNKTVLGKRDVDVLISGCQIAVPPSIHSKRGDQIVSMYRWSEKSRLKDGEFPTHEELPLLTPALLDSISIVVNEKSRVQKVAFNMLPEGGLRLDKSLDEGKYNKMKRQIAIMQESCIGIDEAIPEILKLDKAWNGEDSVFLSKVKSTRSREINALKWYTDQLIATSRGKSQKELEVPDVWTKGRKKIEVIDADGWVRPILPEFVTKSIPPFNVEMIPSVWRDLMIEMSEANNIPIEACLMAHLAPLSSVIGNKRVIKAKKNDRGWQEAHNIWYAYVSKSGTRKTQMLRLALKALKDLQKRADEEYDKLVKETNLSEEMLRPQILELEKRIKDASVEMLDGDGSEEYIQTLQSKKEKLESQIIVPPRRQVIINSVTTEKLLTILANNPSGSCMVFNELSEMLDMFKKKGLEVIRKVIMNAWDGLDSYRHETKSSGDIVIDKMCLSVIGSIQPSLFKKEMAKIYHGVNDDGLFQRFFVIYNNQDIASDACDLSFSFSSHFEAYEMFHKAYDLDDTGVTIDLSKKAYGRYMEYEAYVNGLAFSEEVDAIGSFWSKNTGKIVKIASLFEFLDGKGADYDTIGESSFIKAHYIMDRQAMHIRSCFPDEQTEGLNEVISMIQSGIIRDGETLNNLQRTHFKYFGKKKQRDGIMRELEERKCIRVEKAGKSTMIRVNPYLF